jgi:hypothetical protein
MTEKELKRLAGFWRRCRQRKCPLAEPPPSDSRFGSPLKLSLVHWLRPEVVVEVTYLTWTKDNLQRQVSYQAQREDKQARQVVRPVPHLPRRGRGLAIRILLLQPDVSKAVMASSSAHNHERRRLRDSGIPAKNVPHSRSAVRRGAR